MTRCVRCPYTGEYPLRDVVEVFLSAKSYQEALMTGSKREQPKNPSPETVVGSQSPQRENAMAEVVDTLSAVTISGHEQETENQSFRLVVQGTEKGQFETVESESGGVLAIGHTEVQQSKQVGSEQHIRMSISSPVP